MRKNKINLMAKDQTISSSINYWKNMRCSSESFCGLKDQQANENKIWLRILNDLELIKKMLKQNMNFLDLCTGWGRLIFRVALKSKLQFESYEGIDINFPCKYRFEGLANMYNHYRE